MNTNEIETVLYGDCGEYFQGVYSMDTLPVEPSLIVCNTDPSTKPGQHWIAIYVDKNRCGEYFDSFGRAPNKHFTDYLNEHCRTWTFNKKQLQSIISSFCGYYCCLYCMHRCRGINMKTIVNLFTTDTAFYDSIVYGFIRNKS